MKFIDWVQVIVGAFVVLGVIVALVSLLLSQANERRRTQGIVIAHEARPRSYDPTQGMKVAAAITNEGQGPAFNVRFGVSIWDPLPVSNGPWRPPFRQSAAGLLRCSTFEDLGQAEVIEADVRVVGLEDRLVAGE